MRGPWERASGGLNVVWLGPDAVIKCYLPRDADEARYERDALRAIAGRVPAPVPEILAEGEVDGWPWVALSRLRGTPLLESGLDRTGRLRAAHQAGEWLAALHAIAAPPSIAARRPNFARWLLDAWPDTRERHLHEGLATAIVDASPERVAAMGLTVGDAVFAHADLHDENLLVDEHGKLTGVLDFGDAAVAPIAFDLVAPVVHVGRGDRAVIDAIFAGLGRAVNRRDVAAHALLHPWAELAAFGVKDLDALLVKLGA